MYWSIFADLAQTKMFDLSEGLCFKDIPTGTTLWRRHERKKDMCEDFLVLSKTFLAYVNIKDEWNVGSGRTSLISSENTGVKSFGILCMWGFKDQSRKKCQT